MVRIVEKPRIDADASIHQNLRERLNSATETDERQQIETALAKMRQKDIERLLSAPFEDLFEIGTPRFPLPSKAQRLPTVICDGCHEGVMASRIVEKNGKKLCLDCVDA